MIEYRALSLFCLPLAAVALSACDGGPACGDPDTHTVVLAEGGCGCEEGYAWENPDSDELLCVASCTGCPWSCNNGVCEPSPVGGPCVNDSDCGAGATCFTDATFFPGGYCSRACAGGCPEGSSCFSVDGEELCLDTCEGNSCRAGYDCIDMGACWAPDALACPLLCGVGENCAHIEECVPRPPSEPPAGTVPACSDLPSWECEGDEAYCGALVPFEPAEGDGYWNYPLNGETAAHQYRSFVRRDVMLIVKHAAAATRCLTAEWSYGNHEPIGLGDMSEADGAIPGTAEGDPGHPPLSHTNGHDMDIAYFQIGMENNLLDTICPYLEDGWDAYHCMGPPDTLDPWRTALFIGELHDSPQTIWIGVDGQAGDLLEDAMDDLCAAGWLDNDACTGSRIEYEEVDEGIGWYYFHHHHLHLSVTDQYGNHPEL